MAPGSAAGPLAVDVIVIGGGLSGGLPAAAYLQKAGLRVLVVEANAEPGSFGAQPPRPHAPAGTP
jgi:glycine/D-amino acid oxidase-like deaminating enzyme